MGEGEKNPYTKLEAQGNMASGSRCRMKEHQEEGAESHESEPRAENMSTFAVYFFVRSPWVPVQVPVRCHG